MHITPIKTRTLVPPQDDFFEALTASLPSLPEESILALSSKAVAIGEGRALPIPEGEDIRALKERIIEAEADLFVCHEAGLRRYSTIIHGSLMGSAGVDESNGNGHLILWPADPMTSAASLRTKLKAHYNLKDVGVVITDSHSMPLHNGAVGLAIGYAGFLPIKDYRDTEDLFGRTFKLERLNVADSIATAASFIMGEGRESTPAALCVDVPHITWSDAPVTDPYLSLNIPLTDDLFYEFLKHAQWEKGGGGYTL